MKKLKIIKLTGWRAILQESNVVFLIALTVQMGERRTETA
jgi:hypothetical protein